MLLIVGLNPSTADVDVDDPTVRRCVGFAKLHGFDGLLMGNLFAARSSSPSALPKFEDPVGPENDHWLGMLQDRSSRVVVAWGNRGSYLARDKQVLKDLRQPYCFGKTKEGAPCHPLYLKKTTTLEAFA